MTAGLPVGGRCLAGVPAKVEREVTLVAEAEFGGDRGDRVVALPQGHAGQPHPTLHPVGPRPKAEDLVERPLQLSSRQAAGVGQSGQRRKPSPVLPEDRQGWPQPGAGRAGRDCPLQSAEGAHHANDLIAVVEDWVFVGFVPVGQADLVEPDVDMAGEGLPAVNHRLVVSSVVRGKRPGGQLVVGGPQHVFSSTEADVPEDAGAEEQGFAGQILGEKEGVVEAVKDAMKVTLGCNCGEELLLLSSPITAGCYSSSSSLPVHRRISKPLTAAGGSPILPATVCHEPAAGSRAGWLAADFLGMDRGADEPERSLQVAIGCFEGVGIDRERGAEDNQRRAQGRAADGLLQREPTHRLHRHPHGSNDLAQLVEWTGHRPARRGNAPPLVVADVMNDIVAAEILQLPGTGHHVGAAEIVTHHLAAEVSPGLHDTLDRFGMGAGHHHHVGGSRPGHHLCLEVAAVHCLEVGHDRHLGEGGPQLPDTMQALGQNQRRAGLQPVNAGSTGDRCGLEGLIDIGQIK